MASTTATNSQTGHTSSVCIAAQGFAAQLKTGLFRKTKLFLAVFAVSYIQYTCFVEQIIVFAEGLEVGNFVVHKPLKEYLDLRESRGITQADLVRIHSFGGEKVQVRLVQRDDGFSLHATIGFQPKESLFLIAEHSRKMRVFKSADSALRTASAMGFSTVIVEFQPPIRAVAP